MIEMRENSYTNIRTDEVKRPVENEQEHSDSYRNESPSDKRKSQDNKEQDKFDEYDPWC